MNAGEEKQTSTNEPTQGEVTVTSVSGMQISLENFVAKSNNYGMKYFWAKCFENFKGGCPNEADCPFKHSMLLEDLPDDFIKSLAIIGHAIHWEYYKWLELILPKIVTENRFSQVTLNNIIGQTKNEEMKKKLMDIISNPNKD